MSCYDSRKGGNMTLHRLIITGIVISFAISSHGYAQIQQSSEFGGPLPDEEVILAQSFVEVEVLNNAFVTDFLETASANAQEEAGGRFAMNQPTLTPLFSSGEIEPTESGDTYEDFKSTTYLVTFPFQEGYRRGFEQSSMACGILEAELTEFGVYETGETTFCELRLSFLGFIDEIPFTKDGLSIAHPVPESHQRDPNGEGDSKEDIWFTFRRKVDSQCKTGDWKEVRHKEITEEGVKISTLAYVEAYVIQHLVYVEADDAENRSITLYYWDEGVLKSVFELRQGSYTETDGYDEVSETYNFQDGRLVEWKRSPGGYVDPQDESFHANADWIADSAISRSEVIYEKIGAD